MGIADFQPAGAGKRYRDETELAAQQGMLASQISAIRYAAIPGSLDAGHVAALQRLWHLPYREALTPAFADAFRAIMVAFILATILVPLFGCRGVLIEFASPSACLEPPFLQRQRRACASPFIAARRIVVELFVAQINSRAQSIPIGSRKLIRLLRSEPPGST